MLVMGLDDVHWSYDTLELAGMLPEHVDYLTFYTILLYQVRAELPRSWDTTTPFPSAWPNTSSSRSISWKGLVLQERVTATTLCVIHLARLVFCSV